ncbi:hypothetical protein Glove_132g53 [Diversispora epigaea]|uniref:Uncharacterized protein n=1 Tax=Diversispora epigaea TaxID=1348612 RepID=A0A397IXF0_9GLOM|nr:hypothetical protein Glove_132g53 [Diversispora epigaea]
MGQIISTVINTLEDVNDEVKRRKRQQLEFLNILLKSQSDYFEQDLRNKLSNGKIKVTKESPIESFKESDQKFDILKGFKDIIKTGLNTFLGNSSIGEQKIDYESLALWYNSIVIIDVKIWKYKFETTGVIADCENALCYSYTLSVVDHKNTDLDTLNFLISKNANKTGVDPNNLIKELANLWSSLQNTNPSDVHNKIKMLR